MSAPPQGLPSLALAGVLLVDALQGMIIGLVSSLMLVVYWLSRPHLSTLGTHARVTGRHLGLDAPPREHARARCADAAPLRRGTDEESAFWGPAALPVR